MSKRGEQRVRAGQDVEGQAARYRLAHDYRARVGEARRARVGDERDALPLLDAAHDLVRALALVVLVAGEQRLFYAEVVQQPQRVARVLAGYNVRAAQLFEAAQRHVPEVADGGRHYYQRHRVSSFFVRLIKFRMRL